MKYNQFQDLVDQLLRHLNLEGVYQVASFHPRGEPRAGNTGICGRAGYSGQKHPPDERDGQGEATGAGAGLL